MKKLAYLGPTHTFSDLCYKTHYKDAYSPLHCNTIEEAFDSIDGSTDALVPIENSTDGFVQKTLDLLALSFIDILFRFVQSLFLHILSFFIEPTWLPLLRRLRLLRPAWRP